MARVNVDLTIDAITDYERGKRLWAHESYEVQGEARNRYFVVWADEDSFSDAVSDGRLGVGSTIRVSGLLGARTSEPNEEGHTFVQLSINQPNIVPLGSVPKAQTSRSSSGTSRGGGSRNTSRNATGRRGSETPF